MMNKFDRFLEFIFHTKVGILSLIATIFCGAMVVTGCMGADMLACACESAGCDMCAECYSGMNDCFDCLITCDGNCSDLGMFADGCEKNCGPYHLECGGCNRTCFENGGGGCDGSNSCGICNFTCTNIGCENFTCGTCNGSEQDNSIYNTYSVYVKTEGGNSYAGTIKISKASGNGEQISMPNSSLINAYWQLEGYYVYDGSNNSYKVMDADGTITDAAHLMSATVIYINRVEVNSGKNVVVNFECEFDDVILNPIILQVGGTVTNLPTPQKSGYAFRGWVNTSGETVNIINGDIFHLETVGEGVMDSVTLIAVFE